MSPTTPPRRHLKEPPRSRHKAKPKFDVPAETAAPEAPVGWVYRANEASPAASAPQPRPQTPTPEASTAPENPLLMVGVGIFLIGIGTLEFMSRATYGMLVMPIRFAKSVWSSD